MHISFHACICLFLIHFNATTARSTTLPIKLLHLVQLEGGINVAKLKIVSSCCYIAVLSKVYGVGFAVKVIVLC